MEIDGSDRFPELTLRRSDVLIAVCGYEVRSRHVSGLLRHQTCRRLCIDFETVEDETYRINREWFSQHGFDFVSATSTGLTSRLRDYVYGDEPPPELPLTVVADLSSMSRYIMASVIESLIGSVPQHKTKIHLVYNLSGYTPPPPDVVDVLKSEPVSTYFAGELGDTSTPVALIVGLGYEPGRALGCLDQFEPRVAFAFRPTGSDSRFRPDIDSANASFLELIGEEHVLEYEVTRPMELFQQLQSLVRGLGASARVVVVPFGPKIFAASALLLSVIERTNLSIWRVTGEAFEEAKDRAPTDEFSVFSITVEP